MEFTVEASARLDVLCASALSTSRSQAERWIEAGLCSVNGIVRSKPSFRAEEGQLVSLTPPQAKESELLPEEIPIHILYEDEALAVVEKPRGMVVHPAAGNESGTLVNALLAKLDHLSGIGDVKRPGIIHRLDKDTSGLLLVAKNDTAHRILSEALAARQMEKHYLAIAEERMKQSDGRIEAPIGRSHTDRKKMAIVPEGREALTEWHLLENLNNACLLDVHILTGRTHQIRVHMQSIHHPLAGDPLYGRKNGVKVPALMLHAWSLRFRHPLTEKEMEFQLPPPEDFCRGYHALRENTAQPPLF